MKIVQLQSPHDVRPRRGASTRSQGHPGMVQKKPAKFYRENMPAPNSPDIKPVENLWSIMDEAAYEDPTPKTIKDLKRRLKQAWKKIPLCTLHDLSHSMPQRLRNVILNKGGHAGY